jgi:amidase
LVSQAGIIPISHSQDTAGPMARTVADAALLLDALSVPPRGGRYAAALKADALKGARIGVARKQYFGYSDAADAIVNQAIADMKAAGAVIVDPADIPTASKMDTCEMEVLLYEFKADLNAYLAARGPESPVHSLAELIAFDEREKAREMPYFGQELFIRAQKKGPLTAAAYTTARTTCRSLARAQGIDLVLRRHHLDAIVAPTGSPAWTTDLVNGDHFTGASSTPAAVAGYPSITVPAGQAFGLPVGLSFIGTAKSEARLIALAYAYEQATKHRQPPALEMSRLDAR